VKKIMEQNIGIILNDDRSWTKFKKENQVAKNGPQEGQTQSKEPQGCWMLDYVIKI
jgi:hypothetical protein